MQRAQREGHLHDQAALSEGSTSSTLPGSHNACLQSAKQSSKLPTTATNLNASAACHVHTGQVAPLNINWQTRLKTFRSLSFVLRAQFVKVKDGDMDRKISP